MMSKHLVSTSHTIRFAPFSNIWFSARLTLGKPKEENPDNQGDDKCPQQDGRMIKLVGMAWLRSDKTRDEKNDDEPDRNRHDNDP